MDNLEPMTDGCRTTIGLLGCDVTDLVKAGASPALMDRHRLAEIERRILNMEAAIAALQEIVQP